MGRVRKNGVRPVAFEPSRQSAGGLTLVADGNNAGWRRHAYVMLEINRHGIVFSEPDAEGTEWT